MKQLIPIPIPKDQILAEFRPAFEEMINKNQKLEKFKIEIDHIEWDENGITIYAKLPRSRYNKK